MRAIAISSSRNQDEMHRLEDQVQQQQAHIKKLYSMLQETETTSGEERKNKQRVWFEYLRDTVLTASAAGSLAALILNPGAVPDKARAEESPSSHTVTVAPAKSRDDLYVGRKPTTVERKSISLNDEVTKIEEELRTKGRSPRYSNLLEDFAHHRLEGNISEERFEEIRYRLLNKRMSMTKLDHLERNSKDIAQSRDFLRLAEAYQNNGWDERWALQIATDVDYRDSKPYKKAEILLQRLENK
jgi:hypothetical protein